MYVLLLVSWGRLLPLMVGMRLEERASERLWLRGLDNLPRVSTVVGRHSLARQIRTGEIEEVFVSSTAGFRF